MAKTQKLNRYLEQQIYHDLCLMLANITDPSQIRLVLDDLLSGEEFELIAKRLAVAQYLDKGRTFGDIKNNLAVNSTVIAQVAKKIANRGYQIALNDIKAEVWADNWSRRLARILKPVFS